MKERLIDVVQISNYGEGYIRKSQEQMALHVGLHVIVYSIVYMYFTQNEIDV